MKPVLYLVVGYFYNENGLKVTFLTPPQNRNPQMPSSEFMNKAAGRSTCCHPPPDAGAQLQGAAGGGRAEVPGALGRRPLPHPVGQGLRRLLVAALVALDDHPLVGPVAGPVRQVAPHGCSGGRLLLLLLRSSSQYGLV